MSLIEVKNFHPHVKNTLQGFFDIYYHPFLLKGLTLHRAANGSAWIGFPGTKKKDERGVDVLDDAGKTIWSNCVSIPDKEAHERFKAWCLKEVDKLEKEAISKEVKPRKAATGVR
jgi:hypothetical protein